MSSVGFSIGPIREKFPQQLVGKGSAPSLHHLGAVKNDSSILSDGIVPGGREL